MSGVGDRPRSFAELLSWVEKRFISLERRQLPRAATTDLRVDVTALGAAGMTVGAQGVSYQRVGGFTHIRGIVIRSGAETGLLFVLPSGLRPSAREWVTGQSSAGPRAWIFVEPDGSVLVDTSISNGPFAFSLTFPSLPDTPPDAP